MNKLSLLPCFSAAWKSFSKWWLLLCLVAAVPCLYLFFLAYSELGASIREIIEKAKEILAITGDEYLDFEAMMEKVMPLVQECQEKIIALVTNSKVLLILAGLVVVTIVLQIVLILCSKRATAHDEKEGKKDLKRGLGRSLLLSLSYVVLAFIKLAPFVILFLPALIIGLILLLVSPVLTMIVLILWFMAGLWFYARWYFTDYIITETSANPFTALGESWALTRGNQLAVWVLVLTAFLSHIPACFTLLLSTIPTRSFDFTLRATAYRQLKGEQ